MHDPLARTRASFPAFTYEMDSRFAGWAGLHLLLIIAATLGLFVLAGCSGGWAAHPDVVQGPVSQTVVSGQTATFSVSATGTAPLSYQWFEGGVAVNGATGASYTTPVTTGSDNGSVFSVSVTNAAGGQTSASAILTVNVPPAVVVPPVSQTVIAGQDAHLSVTATGTAPLSYQWYQNGVAVSGANTSSYTAPATTVGNFVYSVVVSNVAGTVTTSTFTLTVNPIAPTLAFVAIAPQTYGNAAIPVSATSASTGAVTYSVVSGPATISGNVVTLTGTGTVVLRANQVANGNYAAATATTSFAVAQEVPTLAFAAIAPQTYGSAAFPVSATSASSGAVTYSVASGPATIAGNVVTLTGTGTVVLHANQVANGNYAAATATTSFAVTLPVTITPVTPANATMAPGPQTFSATPSSGTVTWTASAGTITAGGAWTSPNAAGTYTITATSVQEPSVSASTTVTVSLPVITMQPVSKNACSGYSPSLAIAANYASSYQWTKGGSSVGTASTLTFPSATSSDSGNYSCAAINAAGSVTSNVVTLNIVNPTTLTITTQPAPVSVYATQTATFSVAASGTGTLAYQWYKGTPGSGTMIAGATTGTYTTGALTVANSGTSYYVTVTDPDCTSTTLTSAAATVTVTNTDTAVPPTIVVQPTGEKATVGGTATFTVTASGPAALTYQWYRVAYSSTELTVPTAGVAISGATGSTYTVPTSETAQSNDGDTYYVVVTNGYGSAVSSRVVLAVGAGILLQIDSEPHTDYVAANTLASFTVSATCTGCIPGYQWYWYAPGSTGGTALSDGAVSTGALSGASVAGATTSSITLSNVPTSASGAIFYVVVTSTSDGITPVAGTNPLTSSTAGLFVGSLGAVGNPAAGSGLCNTGGVNWVLNGNTPGTSSGDVPYQNTSGCSIELTNDQGGEHAAVYWPTLISTAKFSVSFTVAISATNGTPADGFTMVLGDPSQGATTSSLGATGSGLGADGIPGFVLGFDTYQNGLGCAGCDPVPVPYMAVGQGATALWENPWTFVNGNLDTQNSTDYTASTFANSTHSYVVTVVNSIMTVTMDGYELFTGTVSLPPAAYLGFTASTGGAMEAVTISALTATVSAP